MLLRELNLIGFGKFNNERLVLREGINLIYGENEAGKSTLHSFIDGMFYGFLKPNVRSTLYLDEHEKYSPWDGSRYTGVIRFEFEGKPYRIERNFTKGEESTKIFDEITGVDIAKNIDVGSGRVLQPGVYFFGFNTRVFSNTISIKQLGSKTDDKLANEVTEKLINITTALDDNISVEKAILELKSNIAEIGTDRAPTRPFARNLKAIETLEEERRKALSEKANYDSYLEEKFRLNNMLEIEEKRLVELKDGLLTLEIIERAKSLQEAEILLDEINNVERKIVELCLYAELSMEKYKEGINLSNSIDYIEKNIIETINELDGINTRLQSIEKGDYHNIDINKVEEISQDFNSFEELEEEKNKILYSKEDNSIEFLKRDYKSYKDKISRQKIILSLMAFAAIVSLVMGQIILFLPFLAISLFFSININKTKQIMNETINEIEKIEFKEKKRKVKIQEIEDLQTILLDKHNVKGKMEFKRLFDANQIEFYRRKEYMELFKELSFKQQSLTDKIEEYELNKEKRLIELEEILISNNVKDLQEFSEGLEKRTLYEKNVRELETKKELLNRVLGENTIDSLKKEINAFNLDVKINQENSDKNQFKYLIERSTENISDIKIALRGVEENLNILGKNVGRLVEIEEEIDRKNLYKEELESKIKSLELAVQTIEELSKDIHSQFAPSINKKVSEIVKKITSKKYTNIKISESLNISVENPITKEIIKIEELSGGTIDQLYFSLRFGIINSMVGDRLPLILDDCFVQYDDIRLRNILKFLDEISKERQIILFSCQKREKKILDELSSSYNLIRLT